MRTSRGAPTSASRSPRSWARSCADAAWPRATSPASRPPPRRATPPRTGRGWARRLSGSPWRLRRPIRGLGAARWLLSPPPRPPTHRPGRPGFPRKRLNCEPAGKAIVASAGWAKGLRDGVSGRVVPDGDEGAFAAAVVELLSDRAARARLGAAARRAVGDPRAWDGVLDRIEAVYRNLLAARGVARTTPETHASTRLPMALPE